MTNYQDPNVLAAMLLGQQPQQQQGPNSSDLARMRQFLHSAPGATAARAAVDKLIAQSAIHGPPQQPVYKEVLSHLYDAMTVRSPYAPPSQSQTVQGVPDQMPSMQSTDSQVGTSGDVADTVSELLNRLKMPGLQKE